MSDILSQEEVDALLSAVSTGDFGQEEGDASAGGGGDSGSVAMEDTDSDRSVKLYDFRRPDRVSKDQMRTLQNLHPKTP